MGGLRPVVASDESCFAADDMQCMLQKKQWGPYLPAGRSDVNQPSIVSAKNEIKKTLDFLGNNTRPITINIDHLTINQFNVTAFGAGNIIGTDNVHDIANGDRGNYNGNGNF